MTGLPQRQGPRPTTTNEIPHQQVDEQPTDPAVVERLAQRLASRSGVSESTSRISVPGARAFVVDDPAPDAPGAAFIVETEFAHIHPAPDSSLHAALPAALAAEAVRCGWAERHPMAGKDGFGDGLVMIYAPRDDAEAEVVEQLVDAAYRTATGPTATSSR
jgi:hypothetical protein